MSYGITINILEDRMKRKEWYWVVLGIVLLIGLMAGCDNGDVVSNERNVTAFEGIITNSSADINIYPGRDYKVIVTTEENIQSNILTEVRSNILNIESKGKFSTKELKIDIYMPELKAITVKGSGDVKINNGSISNLEINISGSGDIDARNYQVENVNINSKGSGDARLWVTETLNGSISGSGDIFYKGNPRIDVKITGSGDLRSF